MKVLITRLSSITAITLAVFFALAYLIWLINGALDELLGGLAVPLVVGLMGAAVLLVRPSFRQQTRERNALMIAFRTSSLAFFGALMFANVGILSFIVWGGVIFAIVDILGETMAYTRCFVFDNYLHHPSIVQVVAGFTPIVATVLITATPVYLYIH